MAEKQPEYIWEAKFVVGTPIPGAEVEGTVQLIGAKTLRLAAIKAEKYQEREGLTTASLVSIVQRNDVVV